jgi:hypothetical protein
MSQYSFYIGHSSVLITTSHPPESLAFLKLAKDARRITTSRKLDRDNRVILLSTPTYPGNLNTYVNMARLFAGSAWILLIPPMSESMSPSDRFSQVVSQLELRAQAVDPTLLFQKSETEPSIMDSLLLPQNTPVWCSERYSMSGPRQEWFNCIQETLSYYENELNSTIVALENAQKNTEN